MCSATVILEVVAMVAGLVIVETATSVVVEVIAMVSGLAITGIVVALLPRLLLVLLSELFVEAHVLVGLFQSLEELILLVSVCCVSRSWSLLVHDSSKGRTMFFHHLSQKKCSVLWGCGCLFGVL